MGNLFQNKRFQNAMFFLATLSSLVYLTWRAGFTLPWKNDAISIVFGILLLGSEITSALGTYELYWRKSRSNQVETKAAENSRKLVSGRGRPDCDA